MARAVNIQMTMSITVSGLASVWSVPVSEIKEVDGKKFVRMDRLNTSLKKLVYEDNMPCPRPCNLGITNASAYKKLYALRADHQIDDDKQECNLFADDDDDDDDDAPPEEGRPSKRRRVSKTHKEEQLIEVTLEDNDETYVVKILSSTSAKRKLYVLLEDSNLEKVIAAFRNSDCAVISFYQQRDTTLPKGIWRRGDGFVIRTSSGGYVGCADLESAIAALADGPPDGEGHDEQSAEADE